MTPDERKAALTSDFGRSFHVTALQHVTWIFWTPNTNEPTDILNHASAFLLGRGRGPMLITAAHVYRQYVADWEQFGSLHCQIANTVVSDLRRRPIACGNLSVRSGEPEPDPDIATFRLPTGADRRIGKAPISAPPDTWPPPPNPGEQVMFGGFRAKNASSVIRVRSALAFILECRRLLRLPSIKSRSDTSVSL
jgi:hypothetical protein